MSELVTLTRDGDVGVITVNNPPVNALSPGVAEGITSAVKKLRHDPSIQALILIGGGKTFIAGELIREAVGERRQRVLVVAPAALRDGPWRKFLVSHVFP